MNLYIFGIYDDGDLLCQPCAYETLTIGPRVDPEGYPDGYSCALCGDCISP